MRVLHIYPKEEPQVALYVSILIRALAGRVESLSTDTPEEASRLCKEQRPDIVHRHGQIEFKEKTEFFRQVVTLHGHQFAKFPNAFVYFARSQMEAQKLRDSAAYRSYPSKAYIETVLNPLITKTTNADEMADNIVRIYQKVLDSNPIELMNDATIRMLGAIMKAGICGDKRWVVSLPKVEEVNFRQIYIYAIYENVLDIVEKGIETLELSVPKRASNYDIYMPEQYKKPISMKGHTITKLLLDVKENGLTMMRMTDIAEVLFTQDIEEDKLLSKLKQEKLNSLFSCVLQIMHESILWDEGYMPCQPTNNTETQVLRTQLLNHLKL